MVRDLHFGQWNVEDDLGGSGFSVAPFCCLSGARGFDQFLRETRGFVGGIAVILPQALGLGGNPGSRHRDVAFRAICLNVMAAFRWLPSTALVWALWGDFGDLSLRMSVA